MTQGAETQLKAELLWLVQEELPSSGEVALGSSYAGRYFRGTAGKHKTKK